MYPTKITTVDGPCKSGTQMAEDLKNMLRSHGYVIFNKTKPEDVFAVHRGSVN